MSTPRPPRFDNPAPPAVDPRLEQAARPDTSPFDFIIVGSGAGGGPLACRLARAGRRVLLIEAGPDPRVAGEAFRAPIYNTAASEHPELSWDYSVRHYADTTRQQADTKYQPAHDRDGTGGIFYPRSSGLGGCTGHHAMIVLRPNGSDWDRIAKLTGDPSWAAPSMEPFFARFERCLYLCEYRGFLANILGWFSRITDAIAHALNPNLDSRKGDHGRDGWQPTSFISPFLIRRIMDTDKELAGVLLMSLFTALERSNSLIALLRRFLITLGFVRAFDPNDTGTRRSNPGGGVVLIPCGIGGPETTDESGASLRGERAGLREFLLETRQAHPDRLVIVQGVHVRRVLLDDATPPRAIGVAATRGRHLYRASPLADGAKGEDVSWYVRPDGGEVILCAGSFNTPQLLLLSGIGDAGHIAEVNVRSAPEHQIRSRVHLPGVGANLQDRYEIAVLSELREPCASLKTVSLTPGDPDDQVRREWLEQRTGLYATNGGSIGVLHRSQAAGEAEPDLFAFCGPAGFRGYYRGYSRDLLKARPDGPAGQHNLWSWVILKAYARNNAGTVRLRTGDPFDTPAICFHCFDEGGVAGWDKDLDALVEAVEAVRRVNANCGTAFARELQPEQQLARQNETRRQAGQPEWTLRDWIRNEAWGHHACGTARLGADPWRANPAQLNDPGAVLDSHFRVHGVRGLRVVDASVFPWIPGYFLLAPIFMVSEKAAEVVLADTTASAP